MLIEIESVHGNKIIFGKHLDKRELQNAIDELLKTVYERDFPTAFCVRYRYEEVQCTDPVRVDYVIDLDTHLIMKPQY